MQYANSNEFRNFVCIELLYFLREKLSFLRLLWSRMVHEARYFQINIVAILVIILFCKQIKFEQIIGRIFD